MAEPKSPTPGTVQSMERGLAVIRAFDSNNARMTLSQVARRTDLTRATARRFLHTLVALDYMDTDGSQFWLRPRILELGFAYLSSLTLPDIASPHLKALSEQVHESSSVSVLDGTDVVYVARIPARRIMAVGITVGTRFPAYATSMGRALLAGLPPEKLSAALDASRVEELTPSTITSRAELERVLAQVRDQGYALVDQELEVGLRSVAVPIHSRSGEVIAAVNISVPSTQVGLDELHDRLLPALMATRDAIERDLHLRYPAGGEV